MAFPTSLDAFTTKVDNTTDVLAAHINDLQTAMVAVQTKIGVNSSAVTTTLDYQMTHLPSQVATLAFGTTYGVQFRDAGISIASLDDGHLDLTADVAIDMNAPVTFGNDTTLGTATKMIFRAATQYINSGSVGYIDIVAATGINMTGAVAITGALTATTVAGITGANLCDKSAAQTIANDWTWGTTKKIIFRDATTYMQSLNAGYIDIVAATGIRISGATAVTGALTATSFGGITSANLMDKTAATTITGVWTWDTNVKQQYRDTAIYINSGADGYMDIVADTGIRIAGATAITGALTVSTTLGVTGAITGASYGGVTHGNLCDKTAATTLTGVYTLDTTTKLQIRDSAIYINSANDGYLDIAADVGIRIAGATVITGALTATSFGGITSANLCDKTAATTITGARTYGTTTKLQFRDTATYIYSANANYLDIVAATQIRIAGATAITGALTVSTTLGVTGAATLSSTLGVTGAATLSSTLGVTGAVTMSSTLAVSGALTAASYGGITAANIADITASRSISGAWTLSGATPLYFRDSAIYIYSDADAALRLVSDGSIHLAGAVGVYSTAMHPVADKTGNVGTWGLAWGQMISDDYVTVSHSWFDEGMTVLDEKGKEKRVSDLEALLYMTASTKINAKTGRPYIEKTSLPVEVQRIATGKDKTKLLAEGKDPEEHRGTSEIATTSWLMGGLKEAYVMILTLQDKIAKLEKGA